DALQLHSRGDRLLRGEVHDLAFENDAVGRAVPMRLEPLVDDLDPWRNDHLRPANVPPRVDIELRGRSRFRVLRVGGVEVGWERPEARPALGSPDHETPVDPGVGLLVRLPVRVEPEALADAVVNDDPPGLDVDLRERGEESVQDLRIAAALGMPLASAER